MEGTILAAGVTMKVQEPPTMAGLLSCARPSPSNLQPTPALPSLLPLPKGLHITQRHVPF